MNINQIKQRAERERRALEHPLFYRVAAFLVGITAIVSCIFGMERGDLLVTAMGFVMGLASVLLYRQYIRMIR